jgi:hypothetical protein
MVVQSQCITQKICCAYRHHLSLAGWILPVREVFR